MHLPRSLRFSAALSLLAAAPALAQTGPWKDGELLVGTSKPVTGATVIYRIDPATGHGAELLTGYYPVGYTQQFSYDPYRAAVLANVNLPPDPYWYGRLWKIAPNGAAVPIPALDGKSLRAITPIGDGRVYLQENFSAWVAGPLQYLDANDALHTVMDASGTAPFQFAVEHLVYHAPTNALVATTSNWWSYNDCAPSGASVFRIPLSADGSQVAGPITCNSYASSNEEIMSLDYLPGGKLLMTVASGAFFSGEKLVTVDPVTLAIAPWAVQPVGDVNGGYWSAKIGKAIVLDDGSNVLRTYTAGSTGPGPVLATDVPVSDFTSGYAPTDSMWELDVLGPACQGYADVYGAGLAGKGGIVPVITAAGCPDVGSPFSIAIASGLGGTSGILALGPAPASIPLFGGTIHGSPAASFPIALGGAPGVAGAGSLAIPVTIADPAMAGVATFLQAGLIDVAAPQLVSLTSGLQIVIG